MFKNTRWTGTIVVLDSRTREATASIHGSRDFADNRAAIDAALASVSPPDLRPVSGR